MSILDNSKILKAHGCDVVLELVLTQLSDLGEEDIPAKNTDLVIENIVLLCGDLEVVSAEIVKTWLNFQVPVEIIIDSNLPSYVSNKTLVVICNLSDKKSSLIDDTIERARNLAARVELVTCGSGVSSKLALDSAQTHVLPDGLQLELTAFRLVEVLVRLLVSYELVGKHYLGELKEAFQQASSDARDWRANVTAADNLAKQLADDILGKTPIIYTGPATDSLRLKWKTSFNQLAKNLAWTSHHPGFDSIEWSGWTSHPVEKPFLPIFLISSFDDSATLDNFERVERTLSGRWHQPKVVHLSGKSLISQLVWASVLADASAVYLATLNGAKPFQINQ